jgi:hypothetical protein
VAYDGSSLPDTYSAVLASGLTCGSQYTLRATALNVAGEGASATAQIKVGEPTSPPLRPRATSVTPGGNAVLVWDDPISTGCLPITHYLVNRAVNGGTAADLATLIPPGDNTYSDPIPGGSFPIGTSIVYAIKAVNDGGTSAASVSLAIIVGQVPNAPTGLAVSKRPSETTAELVWTAGVSISSNPATSVFYVYVADPSGNAPTPIVVSSPTVTLSSLALGETYTVTVTAVNVIGESSPNAPALTLHAGVAPARLAGATSPRLEISDATSITIAWLPPSYYGGVSLQEYRVYYDIG